AETLIGAGHVDIVEAQEYEAPACLLQLRRNLGLGPGPRVPVVVHLHSPTEFVVRGNGWDPARPDWRALGCLEDYTIRTADALLCPSRFLAAAAEAHYRLPGGSVEVIPYPIGDATFVERTAHTWRDGTVCYV